MGGGLPPPTRRVSVRLLLGLLDDPDDPPALGGGQRPRLHQEHTVADAAGIVLVVRLVLGRPPDDLAVEGVLDPVLDGDHHGLVHLVADDDALARLAATTRLPARP